MAGNIKGITIEFRGDTTKLDKALRSIKKESKGVDSQLKEVNRALKFNPNNTELIAQKQTILKQKIKTTKDELNAFKNAEKELKANNVDEQSQEWMEVRRNIIQCESKLKYFNKELKKVAAPQLKALGQQLQNIGNKMTPVGRTMSTTVTPALTAGFALAIKEASDYAENMNKVDVAFGNSAKSVKRWANNATKNFGLSKNAALEMTSQFGDMGTSMGLSQASAAKMSTSLAGLAGDLASFKNIGVDEAMTALNGVFTGETESLKTLGIVMTETNLKQFAEECGLVYDSMTQAEKVQLRYNYVMAQTKNAQGDYARTADGTANSTRTLTQSISNLAVEFGEILLPIITPLIQGLTKVVEKIGTLPKPIQTAIVVMGGILLIAGPLIIFIGSLVTAIGTLIPVVGTLSAVSLPITGTILLIAAAIAAVIAAGVLLYKNWDTVKQKAQELWANFKSVAAKIAQPFKDAWQKIKNIVNKIKGFFPIKIGRLLKNVKLPHFSLKWSSKDFGKLGTVKFPTGFNIKWYKTGGIFTKPTLLGGGNGVGEAGAEAVLPLSQLWKQMDKQNNELINGIITALSVSNAVPSQKPIQVTVNLGGAKVAEQIFKLNKQGQLALKG